MNRAVGTGVRESARHVIFAHCRAVAVPSLSHWELSHWGAALGTESLRTGNWELSHIGLCALALAPAHLFATVSAVCKESVMF